MTCSVGPPLFDHVGIIWSEVSWSSVLCRFLQSPVTSSSFA